MSLKEGESFVAKKPANWPEDFKFTGWLLSDARVLDCPVCGAKRGAPCVGKKKGLVRPKPHDPRIQEVLKIWTSQPWTVHAVLGSSPLFYVQKG